jgi:hypothetical protein
MSTTNLIASMRFLSLATAALVTGPAATHAAMDPPASQRDPGSAEKGAGLAALQGGVCRKSALDPCHAQMRHSANLVRGDLS